MACKPLLISIFLAVAGCAHYIPPTDGQRSQSLHTIMHAKQQLPSLELFAKQRSAVIINGSLNVFEAAASGQTLGVRFERQPGKDVNGPSHAVAIDSRGYFLTAAHCLNEPSTYLIYFDGECARIAVPRVVAKVFDSQQHLDLALIHVDSTLPFVFEWADAKQLIAGQPALAVGSSALYGDSAAQGFCTQICMGGKISSTNAAPDGTVVIYHDLPLRPGDSGGPLVTPDGKLFGLNTGVTVPLIGSPTSIATRPDAAWVARVIEQDLRAPHDEAPAIAALKDKKTANLVVTLW